MTTLLRSLARPLFLLLPLALAAVVYFPVTRVYFIADDFSNLAAIANRGAFYFIVEPFAGHMGFARNLEFYLLFVAFGVKSEPYGWLALVTHLVNVVLFFRVARIFTTSLPLVAFATALWATCPLLVGVLGWFSSYGQSASVTLVLFLLDRVLRLPPDLPHLPTRTVLFWASILVCGATWFSTGIAAVITWPVVLALLAGPRMNRRDVVATWLPLPLVFACIYQIWYWLFFRFEPMKPDEEMFRNMAFAALSPIFEMSGHLLAVGVSALLQNLWLLPGKGDPVTAWWLVAPYVLVVVWGFARADAADRRRMAALLVLTGTVYVLTAVGRANVYVMLGLPPAESARQVRYHYFATFPLALTLVLALKSAAERLPAWAPTGAAAVWFGITVYFVATTPWRIPEQRDCRDYVASVVRQIDAAIDARPAGSVVDLPNAEVPPFCTGIMGYDRIPGRAGLFALFYPQDVVRGRRVRFVESRQPAVFADPRNTRFSRLIVPP